MIVITQSFRFISKFEDVAHSQQMIDERIRKVFSIDQAQDTNAFVMDWYNDVAPRILDCESMDDIVSTAWCGHVNHPECPTTELYFRILRWLSKGYTVQLFDPLEEPSY